MVPPFLLSAGDRVGTAQNSALSVGGGELAERGRGERHDVAARIAMLHPPSFGFSFAARPRTCSPSFAIALADPRLGLNRRAELYGPRRPLRHNPLYGFLRDVCVLDNNLVVHGKDDRVARVLEGKHAVD
jgi:hypothetical protein